MAEFIVAVGFFPLAVTKLTDFVRNAFDKDDSFPKFVWNLVSMALGIAVALLYELEFSNLIPNLPPVFKDVSGLPAQIITGIGIAAVGSFWHEINDFFSSKADAARENRTTVTS